MFGNMGQMMKQAKEMQTKIAETEAKLDTLEVSGGAGSGSVKITANGKGVVKTLKIDPTLLVPDEVEVLEDLLVAAFHDIQTKADALATEEMGKATGNFQLPKGLKLPF